MSVILLEPARAELDDAFLWYDRQLTGLGYDFLAEVSKAMERVQCYPDTFAFIEPGFRRCLINRFPYGIVYRTEGNAIVVVAVAHLHRQPRYWGDRV